MFGSITKLFSGLFGLLGAILTFPLKLLTFPLKLFSSGKGKDAGSKKKSSDAFFLEESDAKGFKAPETKAKPAATADAVASANSLNLTQPKVTVSTAPVNNYSQFGPARRPGANMKSYLDMAKTMKGA